MDLRDFQTGNRKKRIQIPKHIFLDIFRKKIVEILDRKFIINEQNKDVIQTLMRYFCNHENFNESGLITNNASLDKGLYIYGDFGVGKSLFFKILKEVSIELSKEHGFKDLCHQKISCDSFVSLYMACSKSNTAYLNIEDFYKGRLYIDDLGVEKLCFNSYELIGDLMFEREVRDSMTWVTTNLKPSEYGERYGKRLFDRLNTMFNIIKWEGNSFREKL